MKTREDDRKLVTDQMGRSIMIPSQPIRILSLVPSQTELLYNLGLEEKIAGQTIFCIHPHQYFKNAVKVGGTKNLRMDAIRRLNPDLIIGNKEENERGQISELAEEFPVWMSDIKTLEDALEMIACIGEITATTDRANRLVNKINAAFLKYSRYNKGKAIYLIWKNPWMAAGKDTFINDMLQRAGYENAVPFSRYPELSSDQMKSFGVSHIFLSSEPFPFRDEHVEALKKEFPDINVKLVDGELFSWYGSRLLKSADYLSAL